MDVYKRGFRAEHRVSPSKSYLLHKTLNLAATWYCVHWWNARTIIWVWIQRSKECSLPHLIAANITLWERALIPTSRFSSNLTFSSLCCYVFSLWDNHGGHTSGFSRWKLVVTFQLADASPAIGIPDTSVVFTVTFGSTWAIEMNTLYCTYLLWNCIELYCDKKNFTDSDPEGKSH